MHIQKRRLADCKGRLPFYLLKYEKENGPFFRDLLTYGKGYGLIRQKQLILRKSKINCDSVGRSCFSEKAGSSASPAEKSWRETMSFLGEFKEFAMRGNVVDMAVGVVIGGAFGKIVTSLVDDVLMPPLGKIVGEVDFANLFINLSDKKVTSLAQAKEVGAAVIAYGQFINTIINFLLVAFAVFLVIKQINRVRPKEAPAAPARVCPFCKTEIAEDATRCPHCTSQLG